MSVEVDPLSFEEVGSVTALSELLLAIDDDR